MSSWGLDFALGAAVHSKRGVSSTHLGGHFTIAIAFAIGLASPQAHAQAQDLNLQTQLNIFSPAVTVAPLASSGAQSAYSVLTKQNQQCPPFGGNPRLKNFLQEKSDFMIFLKENPDLTIDDLAAQSERFQVRYQEFQKRNGRVSVKAVGPVPINYKCLVQSTTIKTTFPFNPTYETDVLKKGNNNSPGVSGGFGGNVLLTTAGLRGRAFDLVAIGAGETSARYAPPFFSSSFDSVSSQLFYQAFLHGGGYVINGPQAVPVGDVVQYVEEHRDGPLLSGGLITSDIIAFGVQNQTSFTPAFHNEKADLFTPQVTIARQNINLNDSDPAAVWKCAKATTGFCHYANLSLTIGQTFSDVVSQQNFSVAGSAGLGWRIDPELSLALNATATGKHYEDFVGGREDLLLQVGPALTYSHANNDMNVTLQLPVTYYKNYSTVSAAAWSGFIIQPTFSIAFATQVGPTPPK